LATLTEIQAGVPKVSVLRYTVHRWLPPNIGIYLAFFADVYTYALRVYALRKLQRDLMVMKPWC